MKARYDAETKTLSRRIVDAPIADSEEVRSGIVLEYDATGRLIAIQMLHAIQFLSQ